MQENHSKTHITIHDIARELNISASTVSRALQNNPRISIHTRTTVRELAQKYNYQPNVLASSLRKGQGNTVGVIIPRINRNFFSNVIGGMEEVLSDAGYNLMICQTYEKFNKEVAAVQTLINARVNAIIMSLSMETRSTEHIRHLKNKNIRLLFFDRTCEQVPSSSVTTDDEQGAFLAVKHLIDNGYRKIVHIAGADHINIYRNRKNGYLRAMRENGIDVRKEWIMHRGMVLEGGKEAFQTFSSWDERPDAVFCAGDYAALGIISAARQKSVRIPEDLGVVGFSNEPFTEFIEPSLTSVDQKGEEMGRIVAGQFLKQSGENTPDEIIETRILKPELLIRASSVCKTK
ncbi:MAG: LacI family DNA-binding transcriptional regulator [Bacteroidales bacterium]|nr:LacI family DNA-binding transcriptional regulator [Bacteroidales bacterium]